MKSFYDYDHDDLILAAYKYDYLGLRGRYINLLNQVGGNKYEKLKYNGYEYVFEKMNKDTYSLIGRDGYECIIINFHKNIAVIVSMTAELEQCQGFFPSKHGSNMLELAIKFIKKNKQKFNTTQIQLKDNSEKLCKNGSYIDLALFLTLTTGHTFYGKHKFKPSRKDDQIKYVKNYKIIKKIKVKDVKFKEIFTELYESNIKEKIINKFKKYIDKYPNELLIDVFGTFFRKEKFNKRCQLLKPIESLLQMNTGIFSLRGITYHMNI